MLQSLFSTIIFYFVVITTRVLYIYIISYLYEIQGAWPVIHDRVFLVPCKKWYVQCSCVQKSTLQCTSKTRPCLSGHPVWTNFINYHWELFHIIGKIRPVLPISYTHRTVISIQPLLSFFSLLIKVHFLMSAICYQKSYPLPIPSLI